MTSPVRNMLPAALSITVVLAAVAVQQATTPDKSTPTPLGKPAGPLEGVADAKPRYWKGNLHTHSLWSDGDDFPEMIADWYKENDYAFLALTEHNVMADGDRWVPATANATREKAVAEYRNRFGDRWVERRTTAGKPEVRLKPQSEYRGLLDEAGRFLMIPGEEITSRYAKSPVHINAINLRDTIPPLKGDGVAETVRVNLGAVADHRKQTGWRTIASLNHPNFGWGVRAEDLILADSLQFFEMYNGHPSVGNYGDATHPSCERLWDIANAVRVGKFDLPLVYGLATDDAHRYHDWGVGRVNPGRGWVMVRAPHLTAEAIVAGLEAGDFYSSSGVSFKDVSRDGNTIKLTIQGEPGVTYRTEFIATMKDVDMSAKARTGADGQPLDGVTAVYADEIGKVVATVDGLTPAYTMTGDEMSVRARVTSTKPHPNPYREGDTEMAWTQPVRP